MTGLDTNVLVGYIVQDDPLQSRLAGEFIEKSCDETKRGFISQVVLGGGLGPQTSLRLFQGDHQSGLAPDSFHQGAPRGAELLAGS